MELFRCTLGVATYLLVWASVSVDLMILILMRSLLLMLWVPVVYYYCVVTIIEIIVRSYCCLGFWLDFVFYCTALLHCGSLQQVKVISDSHAPNFITSMYNTVRYLKKTMTCPKPGHAAKFA